jgi:GNAT superfamily N-acetyltransferase
VELRTIQSYERDGVLDLLGNWLNDRAFFARYFDHDPTFRDDLCFVAVDRKRIVSTLQVFRKRVRLFGAVVEVAAVGNVFTASEYRDRGLASQLIELASAAMLDHEFDLSLLFATRIPFYGRLGWQSHVRQLTFIEAASGNAAADFAVRPFALADLPSVTAIYDEYNVRRDGTTVRDPTYWQGQLHYAGNPDEDFRVCVDGNRVVAYARGTRLYEFYVIMEHGHLPGYEAALTHLLRGLHFGPASALPGTIAQLCCSPAVRSALASQGLCLRDVEDVFWMWRVVSSRRLATKLGIDAAECERADLFFRLLPPGQSLYWISDRF